MMRFAALFGAFCFVVGCGGVDRPDLSSVTGKITVDGQPMKRVKVIFQPVAKGRPSFGVTDESGAYELAFAAEAKGATPGKHRVFVELLPQYDDDGNELPTEKFLVNTTMQGKKDVEVVDGSNTFDFELTTTDEPPADSDE